MFKKRLTGAYVLRATGLIVSSLFSITVLANSEGGTAGTGSDDGALQEIVVTAERREASEQKTAIVMNVLSGAELVNAGATDVVRAAELIPGVHVLADPLSGAQIAIRGIVNNNVNVGSDPSLALSVDDVYVARAQAAFASFYDVQRVEVLRGPQGTLYGRNSISGAMNIITNDPQHDWGANVMTELGNYGATTVEGMINIPMGEHFALRVAGQSVKHDGYVDGYWDNEDNKAGRVKLLADVTDTISVLLSASMFQEGGVGILNPIYPFENPSNPWDAGSNTPRGVSKVNNEVYDFSGKFRWNTAIGDLTYIRAYTRFDEDYIAPPAGGVYLDTYGKSDQNTDELRLASHTQANAAGKLAWVVGAFWYREIQSQARHVAGEVTLPPIPVPLPLSQYAGYPYVFAESAAEFGQVTYAIFDNWRITAGLRGTNDRKNATGYNNFSLGPIVINSVEAPSQRDHNISYKAELETDVTANSLLYASVTTGFHGGGWQDASPPYSTYNPETITSYEIGSKNEFLNHRARVNLGAYYYDYKNFLVSATNDSPGDATCACFVNAPKARADGLELETQFAITASDQLGISIAYEDTNYKDFKIYQPWSANGIPGGTPIPATRTSPAGLDFSGTPFPYVSKFSGNGTYQHTFRLPNGDNISAQVETQVRSSYPGALGNDPSLRLPAFTKTDVSIGYNAKHWSVSAFARNLESSPAANLAATAAPGPASPSNPITVQIGAPRTYGVRIGASL